jgi:subtilisin family serine protease
LDTNRTIDGQPMAADGGCLVGVIDTGIAVVGGQPHEYVKQNLVPGYETDMLQASGELSERFDGHGTFVTGLILREAPGASIRMWNSLDDVTGRLGRPGGGNQLVVSAIEAVAETSHELRPRVINMSFFGLPYSSGDDWSQDDRDYRRRLWEALSTISGWDPTPIIVIAAGNWWSDKPTYPGGYVTDFDNLVVVGAVDETPYPPPVAAAGPHRYPPKAAFSNFGPWVSAYAPGTMILGPSVRRKASSKTDYEFCWKLWSGTSFAAAKVTGLFAKAFEVRPQLTAEVAIRTVLSGPDIPICGLPSGELGRYVGRSSQWTVT